MLDSGSCFKDLTIRLDLVIRILLGASALSGCAGTFNQSLRYDAGVANAPGTITLSDPKLYRSESLINERADEVAWIDGLIADSRSKVVFKPDLIRELEQITAFSASLGLRFDPAAALNYRRARETGDVQQDIDVLKLQLQLEQLRRDAELFRAGLPTQKESLNQELGMLGDGTVPPASGGTTAATATQLQGSIDKLLTGLGDTLRAEGKPPTLTTVTTNPFDDFRDRAAYRDLLKTARNAAKLDELHDSGNARLVRLNFQASVIPDPKYPKSLGAVQMRLVQSGRRQPSGEQLRDWLEYVNTAVQFRSQNGWRLGGRLAGRSSDGSFEVVSIGPIELLLPVTLRADGRPQDPSTVISRSLLLDAQDTGIIQAALNDLSRTPSAETAAVEREICSPSSSGNEAARRAAEAISYALQVAYDQEQAGLWVTLARKVAAKYGAVWSGPDATQRLERASSLRAQLLARLRARAECAAALAPFQKDLTWTAVAASDFGGSGIRIYEVGPREQVQQVSTAARSASGLALAAAVAASAPGSGAAGEAAAGYSRQAMGRASALERVPAVVGYSTAGEGLFGWVIGPRASLDPKGRVDMQQLLKPYDLSVDLSIPGWWSELELDITTTWAPSSALLAGGALPGAPQRIKVPLANFPEQAITNYLLEGGRKDVRIVSVQGGPVNGCMPSTLLIQGDNVWRTEKVMVIGQIVGGEAIKIAPDMRGVLVTVPAIAPPPKGSVKRVLYLMTPLGTEETTEFEYLPEPTGEACKLPKAAAAASPDAVSIASVSPLLDFEVPAKFTIDVTGANLGKITAVKLHNQAGNLNVSAGGKVMTVRFSEDDTGGIPSSDNVALEFFEKAKDGGPDKLVDTRRARIRRKQGG